MKQLKTDIWHWIFAGALLLPITVQSTRAEDIANMEMQQQSQKISGIVTDGVEPIIRASVRAGKTGTVTDLNGKFILNVKPGTVITVSYVGFKTQTLKASQNMKIRLAEDKQVLNEVVVTALGIKRERKALGYGLDEVKGDAFAKAKETNVINSMAGRVAGLVVSQTASGPSGSTRVLLRGNTEMTGNNQPLYVIDGVPLDNTNFGSAGQYGGYDLGDGISSINPDDIESMSVLKGPAASALYGSRASHGVILITTKSAKEKGKFNVEYNGTFTIDEQLSKWNDVQQIYGMGANGRYSYDATSSTNSSWGPMADGNLIMKYYDGQEHPFLIVPDNASGFFRTGLTSNNTITLSNNNGNTGVRFTFTDMRNRDIVPNTHMSRDIFNLRTTTKMGQVDLDFSANYTREDVKNRPALGDSRSNIGKNLMTLATTYNQEWLRQYQTADGEYSNWNGMDVYNVNPYWDIYKNRNLSHKDRMRLTASATWNVSQHFKLKGTVGADMNWFDFEDYKAPTTPGYESGYLQKSKYDNKMFNYELLAIYSNKWGDFDFNATAGGNIYHVNNAITVTSAQDMQVKDVIALMSFNEVSTQPASYKKQINSIFGTVNVGWRNMLYMDATLRGDKSSTLPLDNNTYIYPSVSGSFLFSEIINNKKLLPYGKIRLSWAQVGSDTEPYQLGLVYTKSKFTYPGYTIGYIDNNTIPNRDLKPTKTNSFEIGFEAKFLNSRIGLDVTWYSQLSKNQILNMACSETTGYTKRLINAGEIENRGIEISLNTRPVQLKDFSWDLNLNFSHNRNKVKELCDGMEYFELERASWCQVQVVAKAGENYGSIIGPDFRRNENGDIIINPQTGLPTYDQNYKVLGNATWDWTGGVNTTLTYKNVSLGAVFDVKVGADLYSMSARSSYETGKALATLDGREEWYRSEEERLAAGVPAGQWTATGGFIAPGVIDNGDGTYRPNDIYVDPQTYWLEVSRNAPGLFVYDNSYVKCREITLSYNFPQSWLGKIIKGGSVSFVARNPFIVWKNIPNIDPDSNYNNSSGMGLEYGSLPSRRSYGLNLYLKF